MDAVRERSTSGQRNEPTVPPLAIAGVPAAGAGPAATTPVAGGRAAFAGDLPQGRDALGVDAPLAHLAEVAAHRGTATPLCIGVLGGAGCGKSFALHRLTTRVAEIARAATNTGGPFLSRIHLQTVDAASLDGEPLSALAAQVYAGLRQSYPELARTIGHVARDPHLVARETGDKLDEARRRLDAERRTLDESGSRLARLTESVLFEAAGSHVDAYARTNRGRLEHRLTAFGITGETIANYKNLVRVTAEGGGPAGLSLRALYAFKGQTRLLVLAVLLALAGIGLGLAIETQDSWLAQLRDAGPQAAVTAASWIAAHMDLLGIARKAAFVLAAAAVAANLWRAVGFVQPILTGVRLLKGDLASRRRDLDSLYAHQTKRVDGLAADAERLARSFAEAEARLGDTAAQPGTSELPLLEPSARSQAQDILLALGRALREGAPTAPQRIILAVDHLDALPPERVCALLDALHRGGATAGLLSVVALDARRLGAPLADLERWIQLPLRLDAKQEAGSVAALVMQALGRSAPVPAAAAVEVTRSALDEPVSDGEADVLAALAPIAGGSPRAVKRFVNLYTLARLDAEAQRGALALMLALDGGGTAAERQVAEEAMRGDDLTDAYEPHPTTTRMRAGLDAVVALEGRLSKADVARAAARATLFSLAVA